MLSALLMPGPVTRALRYAFWEEDFGRVLGAGALLVFLGTLAYVGHGWSVVDAVYFAVSI